jgi:hypothetical protein
VPRKSASQIFTTVALVRIKLFEQPTSLRQAIALGLLVGCTNAVRRLRETHEICVGAGRVLDAVGRCRCAIRLASPEGFRVPVRGFSFTDIA